MAEYRTIQMAFWNDPFIEGLPAQGKLLYLYLFTSPHTSNLGVLEITTRRISYDTGIPEEEVKSLLKRLEEDGKVILRDGLVWVVNFIRNQTSTSPKIATFLRSLLPKVPSAALVGEIRVRYPVLFGGKPEASQAVNTQSLPHQYPIDTLSIPHQNGIDTVAIPPAELELELERELELELEVKPDAAEIPNSVSACESEAPSPDPIPLFPETPQDLSREERECLGLLKAVPGRKYDHARDLKQLRTLATEYPLVDLRGEVAAACDWLRDNPKRGRGNPSLFLRNWMARSATRSPTRASRGQEQDMAAWLQQFDDPPGGGVVNA